MDKETDSKSVNQVMPKIGEVTASQWPDQTRITLKVTLLDLEHPVSLSLAIQNSLEELLVETTIIETLDSAFELTMHLPSGYKDKSPSITATLYDEEHGQIDQKTFPFSE